SEEHTSELQSPCNLVCRLLLEKKKKTMLDALVPAAPPAQEALDSCGDDRAVLDAARQAADAGALSTIPMLATKGRASYLGERSVGHQDPGATSAALVVGALADAMNRG